MESNGHIQLDARKSWATAAGQVDSYVWSSRPLAAEEPVTLWLVPGNAPGLHIPAPFNGLGLRGNNSSPVTATGVAVMPSAMLGLDGGGLDIMNGVTLPYFQLMISAVSIGMITAATAKAIAHVSGTHLQHLGHTLADLPTIRAYLARMRVKVDKARALLLEATTAVEAGRDDALLLLFGVKAAAGEAAIKVTELAMRVCGGAAFRKEIGIERHFRDARAATVMAPTTDVLYEFIGRTVCGMPLFD